MTTELVTLATTLNDARIQANALPPENHHWGIYGQIAETLEKVLALILGADAAPRAYELLLAGHAVPEALAFARRQEG